MHVINLKNDELDITIKALRQLRERRAMCLRITDRAASKRDAARDVRIIDELVEELTMAKAEG